MKFLVIFAILFSFACKQKPAKIVNRSNAVYSKGNIFNKKRRYKTIKRSSSKVLRNHKIKVKSGDTLYSIAKKYNVTLRDLIRQNDLVAPYLLRKGQRLTIPAPNYHEVGPGDTLYSISRLYGMKLDRLVEMNDLQPPYSIRVRDKIRIGKFTNNSSKSFKIAVRKKRSQSHKSGFIERTLSKFNHFSWPVHGKIISKFGPKSGGLYNDGIKISAAEGSRVNASEDGIVAYVGNELKGYGNLVIIKHSGGWITAYAHLKSSLVRRGQKVNKGQNIGAVGSTGNVSSSQLYFGLRKGRDAVNPERYLKKK